ncbi:MAG: DUF58 domain-containing protein [Planctomycetes bacterium]|nr:DUF58 domain-containing protein [Planctomycetota bacterium]
MAQETKNYLDPKILAKVERLEVRARLVVEGFISGMHKSPYKGFSVEFAQHREYVPGDDVRFVDWKIWGKSDRFYIKEFEEETNLRAWLFVDQSESMAYAHDGGMSKFDYAATGAASLAFLLQQQADAVGLSLFDDKVVRQVPASNTRNGLGNLMQSLQDAKPTQKSKIGSVLTELASSLRKRGVIAVFSDLFDDADEVLKGIRALGQRGHDVIVFHVFDKDELEFPFERMTLFEGLEQMPELLADPRGLRDAYLAEVRGFQDKIRRGCLAQRADYVELSNGQTLDVVLSSYLSARMARSKRAR